MRRAIAFLLLAATAAPIAAQAQDAPPPPDRAEQRHDRREVQGDRREVRGDRREVQGDRREVRGDVRRGDYGEARRDQAEQRRDQAETWRDRRDLNGDRRDLRDDRRDARDDHRDGRDDRRDGRDGRPGYGPRGPGGQGGYAYGGRGSPDYRQGYNWRGEGRWNRDWRQDRRYDWQGYRYGNRALFRAPRYYGPRGYEYRRWAPGARIAPYFYGRGYWIADPYRYRLPPAYGPYRWVRYYDDVLLVDVTNGFVADVISDVFWR